MWDCEHCGCKSIAGTVTVCPQCRAPREGDMAKVTSGGASNAALAAEAAALASDAEQLAERTGQTTASSVPATPAGPPPVPAFTTTEPAP